MHGPGLATVPTAGSRQLATEADRLLDEIAADPVGRVSASVYDTGRLVALAPGLAGHPARLDFLCRSQRPDLGWGGPDGYALVPTLSATAGLLAELRRGVGGTAARDRLVQAATGGLRALRGWLAADPAPEIPDTVASELVIPALLAEVNQLAAGEPALPDPLARPLPAPAGFDRRRLDQARERCATGQLPPASMYCLEVLGPAAAGARSVRPAMGAVGCSPAATAAWAGGPDGSGDSGRLRRRADAVDYLETLQAREGGPVPVVAPIAYFEPAWVLNSLGAGGLAPAVPQVVLDRLDHGLGSAGAPVAPGLPPDADDTGAVLSALLRHGRVRPPDSLLGFLGDGYFRCYHSERDPSLSANAHALEALALYLARRPAERDRFGAAAATAARWLLDQQRPDGSWWDKWHASPYYATSCTVSALSLHGGRDGAGAIARAVGWVLAAQRPDGSWGRWQGSVEETAYALQILARTARDGPVAEAIRRGGEFLADPPPLAESPSLWHGKDLYTPVRVVQAARLAALRLASTAIGAR